MFRSVALCSFLALALSLGASSLEAQPRADSPRVGTLSSAWGPDHPAIEGLKSGLRPLGFEAGRNITFDDRYTEGDLSALPAAAAELVRNHADVIFTSGDAATRAAMATTTTIPIVFSSVSDPVAGGFVRSIAHPGGNVTGVSTLVAELTPKRFLLLGADKVINP